MVVTVPDEGQELSRPVNLPGPIAPLFRGGPSTEQGVTAVQKGVQAPGEPDAGGELQGRGEGLEWLIRSHWVRSVFALGGKEKMGGLLAVSQGSAEEPRMIVLEHRPKKPKKSVVLIGKGVTFDSGGISLKPSAGMGWMKYDMCGAATVMGVMRAVADLDLPIKIVGLIPAVENMPSGTATKPGDILTMASGKTVEVDNTDAEGRLILADALHYSARFNPDVVLDFATLTGACVVALGHEAAGIMSNDDELVSTLQKLGDEVGERVWPLPLYEEYLSYLESDWADLKNSGSRWGGSVTAGSRGNKVQVPSRCHTAQKNPRRTGPRGFLFR